MRSISGAKASIPLAAALVLLACSSDDPPASAPDVDGGSVDASAPPSDAGGDAGDGGAAAPGTPKRGSRLAPRYRETSDGYSQFFSIADTALGNATCAATRAADGALRCLPSDGPVVYDARYSDAACTARVIETAAGCAKPAFAMSPVDGTSGCETQLEVHDVGAAHPGTVYAKEDGGCVAIAVDPRRAYYAMGATRPPKDFVKLVSGIEPIAGGVGVAVVDGEDGSRFPRSLLVDVARSKACDLLTAADGKKRCLPSGAATVAGFTDAACSSPAALATTACEPLLAPSTALVADPANAGRAHVHELGAKRPTKEIYQRADAMTCSGPSFAVEDVHDLGTEIPPASFPEMGETTAGGSRIVATRLTAGGALLPRWNRLEDTMLGVRCSPSLAGDGKLRCLPQALVRSFSDDQCTVPIVIVNSSSTPSHALAPDASCPRRFPVVSVGAEITPAPEKVYVNYSGPCVPTSVSPTARAFAVGSEVPASTFAEVVEVVR
jgi:hypothetical protein